MLSSERAARIFLADEHPVFIAGLRACLAEQAGIEIVGQVHSGAQLVRTINEIEPDIALIGIGFNGVSVIETVLANLPHRRVIAVAEEYDHARSRRLIALGARGYVLKHSAGPVFVKAIATVLRGCRFIDTGGTTPASSGLPGPVPRNSSLTEREREVLKLIALGFSTREAADRLGITAKSAETYKARASLKLDIDSRWKIVQYGIVQGWFE